MMKNSNNQDAQEDGNIILDICTNLKNERIFSKIDLETASKKTKIGKHYLKLIESGDLDSLPFADIYKKNFIKKYANYLEIKINEGVLDNILTKKSTNSVIPKQNKTNYSSHNLPLILRIILVSAIILGFFSYLGFQIQNILKPPSLIVYSPENGQITQEYTAEVHGKTKPGVNVFINGKDIKSTESGEFNETINLNNGLNTITISAKKKYGKTITETRYIILKENQEFSYIE
ncbi:MAG: helix-turn-helix domain-containing protein [Candidatus Magasanikbacteria bacterium]|nr:helix-turn-helix domain-containing protein [Candidatus Magasanikbacteria bacterium]